MKRGVGSYANCCRKARDGGGKKGSDALEWCEGFRETPYAISLQFYDLFVNL